MKLYFPRHNKAQGGTWQELHAHCAAQAHTFAGSFQQDTGAVRKRTHGQVVLQEIHPYTAYRKDMAKEPKGSTEHP